MLVLYYEVPGFVLISPIFPLMSSSHSGIQSGQPQCICCLVSSLLWSGTVCQSSLGFHDLDGLEEYDIPQSVPQPGFSDVSLRIGLGLPHSVFVGIY